MARWVEAPDPASQVESRAVSCDSGVIGEQTTVRIPATFYRRFRSATTEAQQVFDCLAMRMSHVFPYWKGTREDFRFADHDQTVVFVLTPKKGFIRVEIRTDTAGYHDRHKLFPLAPSVGSAYPGDWVRANVSSLNTARAIAEDVESTVGNQR